MTLADISRKLLVDGRELQSAPSEFTEGGREAWGRNGMIPVRGLYESHLTVSDLSRSIAFYRDVVGLDLAHTIPSRNVAFFWVGGRDTSMLGLWSIGSSPIRIRSHVAFSVDEADLIRSIDRLREHGIAPRKRGGGPEIDEPWVFPWMAAASVYFDDPDGHSLEYISVLTDPPNPEISEMVSLSQWKTMIAR